MKNTKKGFTLVELLVVIAIVAILAAVSVVGYTVFINNAHQSNDRTLVAQLNTATTNVEGKYESMHEVAEILAENGFDIAKIKATAKDHEILWDMEEQEFFYSADEQKDGKNIWVVAEEVSDKYSTYYIGGESIESNTAMSICVVTNGTNLTVNAPNADVYHYGEAVEVVINAVASASYHEFGSVEKLEVLKGRVVVEATGSISLVKVDEANAANVKLDVEDNGKVGALYAPETMETTGNAPEASKLLTAEDGWTIVSTLDELKAALAAKNEKIALGADITFAHNFTDDKVIFTVDYSLELNLNSFTLSATMNCTSNDCGSVALFSVKNVDNFTVSGAGKLEFAQVGNNFGWNAYSSTISVNYSNVTINDSVIVSHVGGTDMAYAIDVLTNGTLGDATLTVNGGVIVSPYRAIRGFCNSTTNTVTVTINDGTVRSTNNNAIWFQNPNNKNNNGVLKVTGGIIESNGYYNGADRYPISMGSSTNITKDITGGTFVQNGTDVTSTYINK